MKACSSSWALLLHIYCMHQTCTVSFVSFGHCLWQIVAAVQALRPMCSSAIYIFKITIALENTSFNHFIGCCNSSAGLAKVEEGSVIFQYILVVVDKRIFLSSTVCVLSFLCLDRGTISFQTHMQFVCLIRVDVHFQRVHINCLLIERCRALSMELLITLFLAMLSQYSNCTQKNPLDLIQIYCINICVSAFPSNSLVNNESPFAERSQRK